MAITTNHYDVLVLGDGLGGAVAAALLAAKRYRVGVVKQLNVPLPNGDVIRVRSRTKRIWEGVFDAPFAATVASELALAHAFRTSFEPLTVSYQFLSDDLRVDVPAGLDNLPGDCKRELGELKEFRKLAELLEELNSRYNQSLKPQEAYFALKFLDSFRVKSLRSDFANAWRDPTAIDTLSQLLNNHLMRSLFAIPAQFFTGTVLDTSNPSFLRTLYQILDQALLLKENDSITDMFLDRMQRRGGVVIDEPVEARIERDKKRFVLTVAKLGELTADVCLLAAPSHLAPALFPWLNPDKLEKSLTDTLLPRWIEFHVQYHIAAEGVPEGIGRRLVYVPESESPEVSEAVFATCERISSNGEETAVLDVACLLPVNEVSHETIKTATKRLHNFVLWLCPFVENYIKHRYEQKIWLPDTTGLSLPIANSRVIYEPASVLSLGLKTPKLAKGLYLASDEVFLSLGAEAPFATGLNLARLITKKHPIQLPG